MLRSLSEAKEFALEQVKALAQEDFSEEEKEYIEFTLEDTFFSKLEDLVPEEEIEDAQIASQDELENYLFTRVPNYLTLLEAMTVDFLADYLS